MNVLLITRSCALSKTFDGCSMTCFVMKAM
jgi:hypothetical protein